MSVWYITLPHQFRQCIWCFVNLPCVFAFFNSVLLHEWLYFVTFSGHIQSCRCSRQMKVHLSCDAVHTANMTLTCPPEHCQIYSTEFPGTPPPTHTHSVRERWTPTSLKITIDAPAVPLDYTTRSIDSEDPTFRAILEVSPMIMAHEDWVDHWGKLYDKKKKQLISKQLINCIE